MRHAALVRLGVAALIGIAAVFVTATLGPVAVAPLIGWDATGLAWLGSVWMVVGGMDAAATEAHSTREDPTRTVAELMLLVAAAASLAAVWLVLVRASHLGGTDRNALAIIGMTSVVISWFVVHTLYTLRYATLWHDGPDGGVDFNQPSPPRYTDFAYLAFTIGMTFQVSDTTLTDDRIRANALRHALLSYLYGTVIIATAINVIAGLQR